MKTLLLTHVFPPRTGGSGRWFWEIYRRLPREAFVVVAGEHPRQEAFDRSHDLNLQRMPIALDSWGFVGGRKLRDYMRLARGVRRIAKRQRAGVIHAGCCLPEGFVALMLKYWMSLPYVVYIHGEELQLASTSRELTWMTRRVLAGADYLIVNSKNTMRLVRDDWNTAESRIRVCHPGADTERFVPAEPDDSARRRLGWSERRVVLTVGRLQKRKGQDTMIRALPAIRERVPDVLYAIVGDGEERANLEKLVHDLGVGGHVQFLGEKSDDELIECLQQCDLFALPNRQVGVDIEGFGMVLVEAQACGKPVIAGDSGGTAETMIPGETGFVVDCTAPDKLAEMVAQLLTDESRCRNLGTAGRQFVVESFDWSNLAERAGRMFGVARPDRHPPGEVAAQHA